MRHSVLIFLAAGLLGLAALPARAGTIGFVLGQGPGKLLDSMLAGGYGNDNLYEALLQIVSDTNPPVSGVITPAFLSTLRSCPENSGIFTNLLSSYAGTGVLINTDCTAVATGLQGSGFNGLAGSTTLSTVISAVGPASVVSLSPAYALDATHSVFAIMDSPGSEPAAAPEPASLWLTLAGLGAGGAATWLRSRLRKSYGSAA